MLQLFQYDLSWEYQCVPLFLWCDPATMKNMIKHLLFSGCWFAAEKVQCNFWYIMLSCENLGILYPRDSLCISHGTRYEFAEVDWIGCLYSQPHHISSWCRVLWHVSKHLNLSFWTSFRGRMFLVKVWLVYNLWKLHCVHYLNKLLPRFLWAY